MLRWASGDRIGWIVSCEKACEKRAHVHAQIAGLQ